MTCYDLGDFVRWVQARHRSLPLYAGRPECLDRCVQGQPWPCSHLSPAGVICPECSQPAGSNMWPVDRQVPWPCPTRAALDQVLRLDPAAVVAARASAQRDVDVLLEHIAVLRTAVAAAVEGLAAAAGADEQTATEWAAIAAAVDRLRDAHGYRSSP